MRSARAPRAGQSRDWSWGLRQVMGSRLEDAVMIDRGDVGARGGLGLRQKKPWSEENCGGLRAEDSTGSCHDGRDFCGKSITMGEKMCRC